MSIVDFVNAIGSLSLKLSVTDSHIVFDHLDKNRDGYLNFTEFCSLSDEKRKSSEYFKSNILKSSKKDINNVTMIDNLEELEKMSHASQMYKGFKSNKMRVFKLPKHIADSNYTFGASSLPSDNMNTIISHGFAAEYVQ